MHFSTRASFKPLLQAARANHRIRVVRAISTSRAFNAKESVRIVEVGPRDGLQNEKKSIPVATKIELVDRLTAVGLQTIEAGSFVSPKWVPQVGHEHYTNRRAFWHGSRDSNGDHCAPMLLHLPKILVFAPLA